MKICVLYHPEDSFAAEIVTAAMVRSFTVSQVESCRYQSISLLPEAAVMINPGKNESALLQKLSSGGRKALVLGRLAGAIASDLLLNSRPLTEDAGEWGQITVNQDEEFNTTPAAVFYNKGHVLGRASALDTRHFCRYDFTDEWNNMGYGRITVKGDVWSICSLANTNGAVPVAEIRDLNGRRLGTYAALTDKPSASVLWYNRMVGPVDSLEWTVIEKFFSDHRPDDLKCFPCLSEIPSGFNGAVTMRLDCDQAVSSARDLFELYLDHKIPFSLAILTGLGMSDADKMLLNDVLSSGGSLLSHSHSHLPDWGGNYETAYNEAVMSRQWLEENVPGIAPPVYAVSPFHQNPGFAVRALADAGYRGFIGGIIHNDPEWLFGRAGRAPFVEKTIVSHSQQCMLHGDCYHRYRNSMEIYKQSFTNHFNAGAIFGYLDHPFSNEYQYGWANEKERTQAHTELIKFMKSHRNIWWANEKDCLEFLLQRDSARMTIKNDSIHINYDRNNKLPGLTIRWKGEAFEY